MSQTYTDPRDGSTLRVNSLTPNRSLKEPLLRFLAYEDPTVDLNRESVKALVEQATEWLEDTEVKLPTTPGSIVRADPPGDGNPPHVILHDDGNWYGASGKSALDPSVWVYGWVLIHDAGA